jgi:hypothetical protein
MKRLEGIPSVKRASNCNGPVSFGAFPPVVGSGPSVQVLVPVGADPTFWHSKPITPIGTVGFPVRSLSRSVVSENWELTPVGKRHKAHQLVENLASSKIPR